MSFTYVLLNIVPGEDHDVYDAVAKLPEVRDPWLTVGPADLIARIEVKNFSEITDVFNRIRAISGVTDARTLGLGVNSVGELPTPAPAARAAA